MDRKEDDDVYVVLSKSDDETEWKITLNLL